MLRVYLTHQAEKDIKHLSSEYQEKIKNVIRVLSEEPLKGEALLGKYRGLRRYRVGDFRVVYEVNLKINSVTIIKIKHRKEVYR